MRDLPDLSALRLLVDVASLGSIGAAARRAGIAQQSASQRLRTLEAQTGLTLLHRGAGGAAPTDEGALLVGWATRLLDLAHEVEESIATLRDDRSHQLRIAASMTTAEHLLPPWLVRLRRRHDVSVSLSAVNSEQARAAVADGSADLGFVEDGRAADGLGTLVVARDELVLVASPDDVWVVRARPVATAELARRRLTWREEGSGTRRVVTDAVRALGLDLAEPSVELTTTSAIRTAVQAGSAPAFLSHRAVAGDLASGSLVEVPTPDLVLTRDLTAIWVGAGRPPAGPVRDLLAIATADPAV